MEIKYTSVLAPSPHHRLDSLAPGQCVVRGSKVFVRPASLDGGRPKYDGRDIEAIAIDGSDHYTSGAPAFAEVYEIESITLRRVK